MSRLSKPGSKIRKPKSGLKASRRIEAGIGVQIHPRLVLVKVGDRRLRKELVQRISRTQKVPPADPTLLDPYDWGPGGVPEGKPIRYIPGKGFDFGDL